MSYSSLGAQIEVPTLVRIKPNVLGRIGEYVGRFGFQHIALFVSKGLPPQHVEAVVEGCAKPTKSAGPGGNPTAFAPNGSEPPAQATRRMSLPRTGIFGKSAQVDSAIVEGHESSEPIQIVAQCEIDDDSFENAVELFKNLPTNIQAIVGLGGGKALDIAKYVSFMLKKPYFAVPTSLSNDGFCSPQSSLTVNGRKRSLPSHMPFGVIIDTQVCLAAPASLFLSGVGDLAAKATAVFDWKLAWHKDGTPVNDFAALLSDSTVYQFIANPTRDLEGMRLLGTSLMLNGIAMQICGSSRPASGSEHLLSHALDNLAESRNQPPKPHGLQCGVATYIITRLQGQATERIGKLFTDTGFWDCIRQKPFSREDWLAAAAEAPNVKKDFYTVLSSRDCVPEIRDVIDNDPLLKGCFV
ncbi:hypothetical protein DFJ74DRAFT_426377 [Hyaloraphidium curvatum]|nr:hypothetical protein DFJ74DRAFT_426377 [Hyaloraphidium curvatum]